MRGSVRNASVGGTNTNPAHSSYASSNAIPIGIPEYYLEPHESPFGQPANHVYSGSDYGFDEQYHEHAGGEDERMSNATPSPEPAALIRQASLGKKSKPTLTTVKSGDSMRRRKEGAGAGAGAGGQRQVQQVQQREVPSALEKEMEVVRRVSSDSGSDDDVAEIHNASRDKALEAGGAAALAATLVGGGDVAAGDYFTPNPNRSRDKPDTRTPDSILSSGTGLLDPSSSDSEKDVKKLPSKERLSAAPPQQQQRSAPRSPLAPAVDPRVEKILGGLEKGGALSAEESEGLRTAPKRRPRPAQINVDAVSDAEARGSLTSLSDLIKRATRLASNLDRGRTASRLGMNFFVDAGSESDQERYKRSLAAGDRRSGSISDILASFPPPGLATPTGSLRGDMGGPRRSLTNWSASRLRHSALPSDSDGGMSRQRRKGRRCCGMPLWAFVLLVVVVVLLVAAAVVVPVVLVVVPKQDNNNSGSAACDQKLTCANGGTKIVNGQGGCRCLCVNGFTGSTCTTHSQAGCTTTSVGSTKDVTVGQEIPRLLSGANSDFSIPLNGQTLLGLFSTSGMSCSAENALVTFHNVKTRRRRDAVQERSEPSPSPRLKARQETPSTKTAQAVATSHGIIYLSGSPSSTPSSSSTSTSSTTLDFARVAILYIFQASSELDTAITAQDNLQSYFTSGKTTDGHSINPRNVSLGGDYACDLDKRSLTLGNGTVVGG